MSGMCPKKPCAAKPPRSRLPRAFHIIKAMVILAMTAIPAAAQMTEQDWAKSRLRDDLNREINRATQCEETDTHDGSPHFHCERQLRLLQDQRDLLEGK
jgi:hypothetical protein